MAKSISSLGAVRVGPSSSVERFDDLANAIEGLGTERDSTTADRFRPARLNSHAIEEIYRGSHTAARVCEIYSDYMFQEGWELVISDEKDSTVASEVVDYLNEAFDVDLHMRDGFAWANAYGGAALILGAEDGQDDWLEPLDELNIESFSWATLVDPLELRILTLYQDALAKGFGKPQIYQFNPLVSGGLLAPNVFTPQSSGILGAEVGLLNRSNLLSNSKIKQSGFVNIHESRVIRFDGVRLPRRQMLRSPFPGWGDSLLERGWEHIQRFDGVYQYGARIMRRYQQGVMKLTGLAEEVRNSEDPDAGADFILRRARAAAKGLNIANTLIMDESEEFSIETGSLAGYADLLDRYAKYVSFVAGAPVTIFMGDAPAGLNATGNNDVMSFYSKVGSKQRLLGKPRLKRLVKLAFLAKDGPTGGVEPDHWELKFNPLFKLTQVEQSQRNFFQAQADEKYIVNDALTSSEVAESRFRKTGYSLDTVLDQKTRDKLKPILDKAAMAEAKRALEPPDPVVVQPGRPGQTPGAKPPPPKPGQ